VISRAILRAAARARGPRVLVGVGDLDPTGPGPALPVPAAAEPGGDAPTASLRTSTEDHQRGRIRAAVERHDGNWAAAARELGVARANLHRLARRLGLK
jgi:anaerobic nitric oxide reductase transcription regulator